MVQLKIYYKLMIFKSHQVSIFNSCQCIESAGLFLAEKLRINHIKKNISHVREGKKHEMKFTDKEPSIVKSRYVFVKT